VGKIQKQGKERLFRAANSEAEKLLLAGRCWGFDWAWKRSDGNKTLQGTTSLLQTSFQKNISS